MRHLSAPSIMSAPCAIAWFNGKYVPLAKAQVPITTHALHYGTSVFEGIRAYWNGSDLHVFRLEDHIARLIRSASFYSMNIRHTEAEMIKALVGLCSRNKLKKSCYIRPFCFVGDQGIHLDVTGRSPVHTAMYVLPINRYYDENGVTAGVSSWRKFSDESTPYLAKAGGNYLNTVIAKRESQRNGYGEAIMLDMRGMVSEAPGENVFLVRNGKITTPTLASSPLEGLTRDCVLHIASEMGVQAQEADVSRSELYIADEIFLTGTAAEITPVISIDGKRIGNGKAGPATRSIMRAYKDIVMGKDGRHSDWLTPVY